LVSARFNTDSNTDSNSKAPMFPNDAVSIRRETFHGSQSRSALYRLFSVQGTHRYAARDERRRLGTQNQGWGRTGSIPSPVLKEWQPHQYTVRGSDSETWNSVKKKSLR